MLTSRHPQGAVVVGTPMKAGTWLIRKILSDLLGLECREPPMIKPMDQEDPKNVIPDPNYIYSWHFMPSLATQNKLEQADARVIFVVRNIYAMTLSMYHHFADNIDWDIGRGADKQAVFSGLSKEEGIFRIIDGRGKKEIDGFNWDGVGRYLRQIALMLDFAKRYPCCVLSFEQLVTDKAASLQLLCQYLGMECSQDLLGQIETSSSFKTMKRDAEKRGQGSHFRSGALNEYREVLSDAHHCAIEDLCREFAPELPILAKEIGLQHILDWDNRIS